MRPAARDAARPANARSAEQERRAQRRGQPVGNAREHDHDGELVSVFLDEQGIIQSSDEPVDRHFQPVGFGLGDQLLLPLPCPDHYTA